MRVKMAWYLCQRSQRQHVSWFGKPDPPDPATEFTSLAHRDGKKLMPSSINNSIIAISYEARAKGVTRFFKGKEVLHLC